MGRCPPGPQVEHLRMAAGAAAPGSAEQSRGCEMPANLTGASPFRLSPVDKDQDAPTSPRPAMGARGQHGLRPTSRTAQRHLGGMCKLLPEADVPCGLRLPAESCDPPRPPWRRQHLPGGTPVAGAPPHPPAPGGRPPPTLSSPRMPRLPLPSLCPLGHSTAGGAVLAPSVRSFQPDLTSPGASLGCGARRNVSQLPGSPIPDPGS